MSLAALALALFILAHPTPARPDDGPWHRVGNPVFTFEAPTGWSGQCQTPHALSACTFYQKDAKGRWLRYLEMNPESPGKPTTLEGFAADWLAFLTKRHPGYRAGDPKPARMGKLPALVVQAEFTSGYTGQRLRQRLAFAQAGPDLYLVLDYQAPPDAFEANLPAFRRALETLRLAGPAPAPADAAGSDRDKSEDRPAAVKPAAPAPDLGPDIARRRAEADQQAQARQEAEAERQRLAQAEAKRLAQAEAKRKAQAEAQRRALAEAERKAQAEAERKAQAEAKRKAQAEAERKARDEAKARELRRQRAERLTREAAQRERYRQARLDFIQGVDRFNAGDYDRAVELFERFLRVFPGDSQGVRFLGLAQRQQRALRFGSLEVRSVPQGQVLLDGRPAGSTPLSIAEVPAGRHRVEVRAGGRAQTKTLDIKGRTATTVQFDLRLRQVPEQAAPAASVPEPAGEEFGILGYVVEVQGGQATIDLGAARGVRPGMRFAVVEVRELVHPVSGRKLRKLTRIGLLEITSVQEQVSLARVLQGQGAVAPGQALCKAPQAR